MAARLRRTRFFVKYHYGKSGSYTEQSLPEKSLTLDELTECLEDCIKRLQRFKKEKGAPDAD